MGDLFINRYRVVLEPIGPLFIGSGQALKKKEWVFDPGSKKGYILDDRKLFLYLSEKDKLESFEEFMLHGKGRMLDWMRKEKIYPVMMDSITKYQIDCNSLADDVTDKDIHMFIKDGYGRPYVPGSSLKGAVRNALLGKMIDDKPYKAGQLIAESKNPRRKSSKKFMYDEARELNTHYFNTMNRLEKKRWNAVNDIMSSIKVSDSIPVDFDRLTVCQKIDVSVRGEERSMPLVRECIMPDTKIILELTIDKTKTDFSIGHITDAINRYLHNYNSEFLSKFGTEVLYDKDVIYLGGGAGYHSKTVTSQLLQKEKDRVEITANIINSTLPVTKRNEHKHNMDRHLGVSPHTAKVTEYDGYLYQMGACNIKFEEF